MPRKTDAVAVGRMSCPKEGCQHRVPVYQAVNGYFYLRCPDHKALQYRAAPFQVMVWQSVEPVTGAVIKRPPGVPESAGAIGCALRGEAPAVVVDEAPTYRKPQETRAVQAQQVGTVRAEPSPKGDGAERGKAGVWGLLALLGLGIGFIASGARAG